MTKDQLDELLMAINALVDNAPAWSPAAIRKHASDIQNMAAKLPHLHEIALEGWARTRVLAAQTNDESLIVRAHDTLRALSTERAYENPRPVKDTTLRLAEAAERIVADVLEAVQSRSRRRNRRPRERRDRNLRAMSDRTKLARELALLAEDIAAKLAIEPTGNVNLHAAAVQTLRMLGTNLVRLSESTDQLEANYHTAMKLAENAAKIADKSLAESEAMANAIRGKFNSLIKS